MEKPSDKRSARLPALAVMAGAALWGFMSVFVRQLTALGFNALQIVALRSLLGAVLLGAFLLLRRPAALRVRLRDCWCFVGTGLFSLAFFNWCYFTTIQQSGAGVAVVLLYTSPAFVMLLSALLFGEPIHRYKLAALAATLAGSALVAGVGGSGLTPRALLIGLGSGLGYALYSIFGRFALRRYGSATVTFYTMLFSLLGVVPLAGPGATAALLAARPAALGWGVGIALVCTVLPYLLYTWGLQGMETGRAAVLATIEPVVGTLLGLLAYHEALTPGKLAGMALIFLAVLLLQKQPAPEGTT